MAKWMKQKVGEGKRKVKADSALSQAEVSADPVQDIYLKHLRDYKPPAPKPGDAEQHVHKFASPSGFQSPEEPNLANELSAYQSQAVEVEGQGESAASGEQQAKANEPDWFEQEEDFEAEDEQASGGGH
ncbi:MAG: hypothetical protein Q9162_003427 [Coniocarpon cinnabarinum]